jgi:hypothetical protein
MATHIYSGRYTNTSDIMYTWDGKHLYKGRYTNTSDILYTFDGKHIYQGRYNHTSAIIFTIDGKHIYKGCYTNTLSPVNGAACWCCAACTIMTYGVLKYNNLFFSKLLGRLGYES